MLTKLFHSAAIGIIVALLLLLLLPSLRTGGSNSLIPTFDPVLELPISFNFAASKASPAVVNIYSRGQNDPAKTSLGLSNLGSGVIMNKKGYILTNKHVINNAAQILLALQDGRIFEALLIGSDTLTDIAVLKVDADNLPTITINPERVPHIGDIVLAIGNPYNLGQTVTQGIISAVGRNSLSPSRRQNFLQTDASINHGNSGGALINTLGELVGINTLSLDKSYENGDMPEGLGFAIPTTLAIKVMHKLIRDGRVIRGYIGIEGVEKRETPSLNHSATLPRVQGIIVKGINPDGPAAKAGIQPGDILLQVNHRSATSAIEVVEQIAEVQPGTRIPVLILRNNKKIELQVTIIEYPG